MTTLYTLVDQYYNAQYILQNSELVNVNKHYDRDLNVSRAISECET